jgi:GT2 family glycosyltransferase
MQIAVLVTCHNRRASTIACLDKLTTQCLPNRTELTVYLVDDGCSDGTAAAVTHRFPDVRIISGDGNLYWCGGMRTAWCAARQVADYDGYLWLNDDVLLSPGAISTLGALCQSTAGAGRPGIVVGSTCDPDDTGLLTYGGWRGDRLLDSSLDMQSCDTMCGNLVLVPREVYRAVGNLSPDFRHIFGDRDYGFRASEAGFDIWVAPGVLGRCRRNPCPPWADPSVPLSRRWHSVHSPTVYPLREHYIFLKRHYGWSGLIRLLKVYLRVLFPNMWNWLKDICGRTGALHERRSQTTFRMRGSQ